MFSEPAETRLTHIHKRPVAALSRSVLPTIKICTMRFFCVPSDVFTVFKSTCSSFTYISCRKHLHKQKHHKNGASSLLHQHRQVVHF